jgi:predicted nuclease with RNAse H fold/dephospho-CoA kinase
MLSFDRAMDSRLRTTSVERGSRAENTRMVGGLHLPLHDIPAEPVGRNSRPSARASTPCQPSKASDWRLSHALSDPSKVIFLDVETTGLSWYYDELTLVGWSIGEQYQVYVAGDEPTSLFSALAAATSLVTFNGTLFDLRFLKKTFGEFPLPRHHIDLRYLAKRVGLTGGQKAIERTLGLSARVGLEDVDGAAAVILWHRFLRGDNYALSKLVDYNRHDVVGMCEILDAVLDRLDLHPDLLFSRPRFSQQAQLIRSQALSFVGPSPSGRRKFLSYSTLFKGSAAERATIVGIDLTGSESRPSGWCIMRGPEAETCQVSSDDEIYHRVITARPSIVSIDSPLSLPYGRISVEDSDPTRHEFGIMRRSERELKRRGINVYPCLLPSMQGLTRRGMLLAERLRSEGIPVIESYPGAAQDIMGIPRKGAGIEFLKQGLVDFGIQGAFEERTISHDELDAITSAIVGSFFLSGRFEALQGPSEDALIIPELKTDRSHRMIIGVSGRICAGKTAASRIIEKHGFSYTRFSLVIDDEIVARGETPNRATRQHMGSKIHSEKGQRWLCEKVLTRVSGEQFVVVDGLRFPEDHAYFAENFGSEFIHLHVSASDKIRAARYAENESDGLPFDFADEQPVESRIGALERLANIVISNEGSVAQLSDKVLNAVRKLSQDQHIECPSQLW